MAQQKIVCDKHLWPVYVPKDLPKGSGIVIRHKEPSHSECTGHTFTVTVVQVVNRETVHVMLL